MPRLAEKIIHYLKKFEMFSDLDDDCLFQIASRGKPKIVNAGETIIQEGENDLNFYIILNGTVQVWATEFATGEKKLINTLSSGSIIGEMAVVAKEPRSASVLAIDKALLMWYDDATIHQLLDDYPIFQKKISRIGGEHFSQNLFLT